LFANSKPQGTGTLLSRHAAILETRYFVRPGRVMLTRGRLPDLVRGKPFSAAFLFAQDLFFKRPDRGALWEWGWDCKRECA
jgi:hypothetical protein